MDEPNVFGWMSQAELGSPWRMRSTESSKDDDGPEVQSWSKAVDLMDRAIYNLIEILTIIIVLFCYYYCILEQEKKIGTNE